MPRINLLLAGFLILAFSLRATPITEGTPITLNFDTLTDSEILTTQYSGVTFSNAIILTAGISLNELEFPPHSNPNVVSDNNGPMSITFASQISVFSGYFTYAEKLTIQAFGGSDNLLATISSAYSNNEAMSGDPGSSPNEFLQLSSLLGISSITITGDPNGGSFALDDASYTPANVKVAPEPGYQFASTLLTVLIVLFSRRHQFRRAN